MAKYPKVNYIGNKEKLSDWILSEMPVKEGTVLDLFAGGCSVSYALKAGGYRVISNDILYADYVIARALVENQDQRLEEDIFTRQVSDARVAELWVRFAFLEERLYYLAEVRELARLAAIAETLEGDRRYLFLALLRRAMIRKLPYSRMNVPWNQIQRLRDEDYSYAKYGRKCAYCGAEAERMELDHVVPRSKGGSDRVSNLVPCCHGCNQRKGNRSIEEFLAHDVERLAWIRSRQKAPLKDATAMNIVRPAILGMLHSTGLPVSCWSTARTKWNRDRICTTDLALIVCGMAEADAHPETSPKIIINEYVEIAKAYSTPESSGFVNGLLDKLINKHE